MTWKIDSLSPLSKKWMTKEISSHPSHSDICFLRQADVEQVGEVKPLVAPQTLIYSGTTFERDEVIPNERHASYIKSTPQGSALHIFDEKGNTSKIDSDGRKKA